MPRPKFSKKLKELVFNKTKGKCYHCESLLEEKWDVDHYPVVYRDIKDQCYCFPFGKVTDPLDPNNLQPSCVNCNRSGKYEEIKCYYCNHTQLRVRKSYVLIFLANIITLGIGYSIGYFTK